MTFDEWLKHETGSTWQQLGAFTMPQEQRWRLYNDYEEYCYQQQIPYSLNIQKIKGGKRYE